MSTRFVSRNVRAAAYLVCLAAVLPACIAKGKFPERSAKVYCDKLKECDPDAYNAAEMVGGCYDLTKAGTEDSLDNCDDYKGGLAYKCLQEVKKQSCEDFKNGKKIDACEDFNDACGYDSNTAISEYEGGMTVYGLMDYEFTPPESEAE